MGMTFNVSFEFGDLGIYKWIPMIKETMEDEFIRVYNIYCDESNKIIDKLNDEFNKMNPDYTGTEEEIVKYNKYMANEFNKFADKYNSRKESKLLRFFVDKDCQFKGALIEKPEATIGFHLEACE